MPNRLNKAPLPSPDLTTVQSIVDANQITEPSRLVIGQALVIPIVGNYYYVQPGDSLWSISQRFGMNYLTLSQDGDGQRILQ